MSMVHFAGGHTLIEWRELYDTLNQAYVNDATVSFTVKDAAGNAVSGAENVSMTYRTGSKGNYAGLLLGTVDLQVGGTYWIEITASKTGFLGFRREQLAVQYKGRR